jgi:hypothetical protein
MKAKNIRIGNFLLACGDIEIVTEIYTDYFYTQNFKSSWAEITGVEINEEWIQKLGFKKTTHIHKDKSVTPITYKIGKRIRLEWSSEKSLSEINTGSLMFVYDENLIKTIKYIHELQNLFFAITGDELEIDTELSD